MERSPLVVLGGGVAGLAAAREWGPGAVVVEREDWPGGLVKSRYVDGWWFDKVLHLLYFPDDAIRDWVRALPDLHLVSCAPEACVHTAAGVARYPIQLHLADLAPDAASACLRGILMARSKEHGTLRGFEEWLTANFGEALCELFLYPYNRKMWKRPLVELAPSGFQWNITPPDPAAVFAGAVRGAARQGAYNAVGWYPRPPAGAPVRGMEVLSRALAQGVDVRTGWQVTGISARERVVTVRDGTREHALFWEGACVCTLPLPVAVTLCRESPPDLREACRALTRNRVISVAFGICGGVPLAGAHWRYYADETLVFNRLVFMNAFDPDCSPAGSWGVLAEITQRAEDPEPDLEALADVAQRDLTAARVLGPGARIAARAVWIADPAYVVFTRQNADVIDQARSFFAEQRIQLLGRYGRWEYSSMAQVIRDGRALARRIAES